MLPGMELMGCADLAVPAEVMQHVVKVESSSNPYAIGVVGGRLVRQPRSLPEAVSTARMLEEKGYNFSVGLAQVNRYNLAKYGLSDYARAFQVCPNLEAGSRILADCHARAGGDWGKAFSCYYSGNFVTGFRHGYVQKVLSSLAGAVDAGAAALGIGREGRQADSGWARRVDGQVRNLVERRIVPESVADRAGALPEAIAAAVAPFTAAPASGQQQARPANPSSDAPVVVQFAGASAAPPQQESRQRVEPATVRADEAFVF